MAFEYLRTCIVMQNLLSTSCPEAQRQRAQYDVLLRDEAMSALQLTDRQLRTSLFPGADCDCILTKCQSSYFWKVLAKGVSLPAGDPRLDKPVPVAAAATPVGSKHPSIQKLFGDLVVHNPATADFLVNESSSSFLMSQYVSNPSSIAPPIVSPQTPNKSSPTTAAAPRAVESPTVHTDTAAQPPMADIASRVSDCLHGLWRAPHGADSCTLYRACSETSSGARDRS